MSSPSNTSYECESAIVFLCGPYDEIRALSRYLRQELYGIDLFGFVGNAFSKEGAGARVVREKGVEVVREGGVTLGDIFVPKNMMPHALRKIDPKIYDPALSVHDNIKAIDASSRSIDNKIKSIGEIALIEKEKELFLSSGLENRFAPSTVDLSTTSNYIYIGVDGETKHKMFYVSVDFIDPSAAPGLELFRAFCRIRNNYYFDNINAIYCRGLRDKITGEKYFVESLVISEDVFVETNIPLVEIAEHLDRNESHPGISILGMRYIKTLFGFGSPF